MAVARVGQVTTETRLTLPRLSLETAGLLTLLLGAWVGIVSFVGPVFGFSGDGLGSWHWDAAHGYLFVIPGAAAFLAGLFSMVATINLERAVLGFCGIIAMVAGAWLIIGPVAWPVLSGAAFFKTDVSALSQLAYWIGYSLGPGALLFGFGAFIIGSDRPRVLSATSPATSSPAAPTEVPAL